MDVNKECYNTIGQCEDLRSRDKISLIDVSILGELFVNETVSSFKIKISSGKCNNDLFQLISHCIFWLQSTLKEEIFVSSKHRGN